ncbi:hypothetical protein [Ornithinimicrobium sp. CNJ-824]|uniref:hypothetical protein n=1 Tax=Ornithinimicrobium sp. CNJ-824 TaxID=1904966 RepID=UPI001EDC5C89|nr:hypothetical protein [Ornithinimicrobium sp. CNJ-824]
MGGGAQVVGDLREHALGRVELGEGGHPRQHEGGEETSVCRAAAGVPRHGPTG